MSISVTNTDAGTSGKTLQLLESNQTVTGLHTYDRGTSAPMAVVPGAAKVDNLDADKLDGQEGTYYTNASNLASGTVPIARYIAADPNADRVHFWDDSESAAAFLELVGVAIRGTQLVLSSAIPQGRLTLTSATPVTTADVTAAGTLYYAPFHGNKLPLYNGSAWEVFVFSELSIAAPAQANQVYDVFADYNSGTPQLALTAWTNDTTRATALTTQDGVLVKTGATGQRYLGSVRTVTASQFNDSLLLRHVWNYYNRVSRPVRVTDGTNSWTYDSTTYQQANASAANQVDIVCGVAEDAIDLQAIHHATHSAGASISVSIGQNALTPATGVIGMRSTAGSTFQYQLVATLKTIPAIGRSYFAWIESGNGATTTFYGDNNQPTLLQSGLHGMWRA